jgi:hypothetical protein
MKLNFWQWVGVALLVVAAVVYFTWDKPRRDKKKAGTTTIAPVVLPVDALLRG